MRFLGTQKSMWNTLKLRRKSWRGHIIGLEITKKQKLEIERPKTPFMKQIIEDTGIRPYRELKRATRDSEK